MTSSVATYRDCMSGCSRDAASYSAAGIGRFWEAIRAKWSGAEWLVDEVVETDDRAAIEWSMHGDNAGREFVVRGSEHYEFDGELIAMIRQYWTFDADEPGSELVDFPYT